MEFWVRTKIFFSESSSAECLMWNIINDGATMAHCRRRKKNHHCQLKNPKQIIIMHKDKGNGIVMMPKFAFFFALASWTFFSITYISGLSYLSNVSFPFEIVFLHELNRHSSNLFRNWSSVCLCLPIICFLVSIDWFSFSISTDLLPNYFP